MPLKCHHDGCTKWASFGMEGTKKAELCSDHASEGMVDVSSKRCGHPGCTKGANGNGESRQKEQVLARKHLLRDTAV